MLTVVPQVLAEPLQTALCVVPLELQRILHTVLGSATIGHLLRHRQTLVQRKVIGARLAPAQELILLLQLGLALLQGVNAMMDPIIVPHVTPGRNVPQHEERVVPAKGQSHRVRDTAMIAHAEERE